MNRPPVKNFEKSFERRKRDGVENPKKQTNLSFAAHLAEQQSKQYARPLFSSRLKVKP